MKYLIIEREGMELALLFADYIQHREAARGLVDAKLISAGFCKVDRPFPVTSPVHVVCWGKSDSLNLSSRGEEDAAVILFTITLPSLHDQSDRSSRGNEALAGLTSGDIDSLI